MKSLLSSLSCVRNLTLVGVLALVCCLPAAQGLSAEVELIPSSRGESVPTVLRLPRRLPHGRGAGAGAAELASELTNGDFEQGLDGWQTSQSGGAAAPGAVTADAGAALLAEGDSFLVTLAQTFAVPQSATFLSMSVALEPGFDVSSALIPDAFEISLLDAQSRPVVEAWDVFATSCFNLGEDGIVRAGPQVSWDGLELRVDLTAVPAGTELTLYVDLIGADGDTGSAVRVDAVQVETGTVIEPEGFLRGNSNNDVVVDISDPIFTLNYLFLGTTTPNCLDSADANNDESIDISDGIFTLAFLFNGGEMIPSPYPECGCRGGGRRVARLRSVLVSGELRWLIPAPSHQRPVRATR